MMLTVEIEKIIGLLGVCAVLYNVVIGVGPPLENLKGQTHLQNAPPLDAFIIRPGSVAVFGRVSATPSGLDTDQQAERRSRYGKERFTLFGASVTTALGFLRLLSGKWLNVKTPLSTQGYRVGFTSVGKFTLQYRQDVDPSKTASGSGVQDRTGSGDIDQTDAAPQPRWELHTTGKIQGLCH